MVSFIWHKPRRIIRFKAYQLRIVSLFPYFYNMIVFDMFINRLRKIEKTAKIAELGF